MLKQKKAAFEMSITTIVVLVIAMTMLVLGLVLVRSVFKGATENVLNINEKVKGEIDKLFTEEGQKTAIYLSQRLAQIKQNEPFGVAFAIKNLGTADKTFSYATTVVDVGTCGISASNIAGWIITGKDESGITISPGDAYYTIIRFQPPLNAPLCMARFKVEIKEGTAAYDSFNFDVQIKAK